MRLNPFSRAAKPEDDLVSAPSESAASAGKEHEKFEATSDDGLVAEDGTILLGPEPTAEELETLRIVSDTLPLSAWYVAIVELAERFTYYGCSGVFQNYMSLDRDGPVQPGGLGLGTSSATALSYFFQFWCYITPIPGGLIADMWLGKYWTIFWSACIYIIGNLVLFVTSLPSSIRGNHAEGGYIAAIVIIGIGTGGIKANVSTLIADQYTNTRQYVKTLKSGERVIVDPAVTMQTIFQIFYMCINVGSLSAIATTELEHNVDFWAAFLLPFAFFFVAIIALFLGRGKYVQNTPTGSPVPHTLKICWEGIKNGFKSDGYRTRISEKHNRGKLFEFITYPLRPVKPFFGRFNLEVAKPSLREELNLAPVPWSETFVEEVRRALYGCKVFAFYPIYWVVYGQMLNNFVSQAGTMDVHAIPNDIMQNIDPIAVIIFVPLINKFFLPFLRKLGFPMYPVTRIFWGFVSVSLAMAYAAIVQHIIYSSPPCFQWPMETDETSEHYCPTFNKVHVAVQTPAYVFIALSEIFASVTGLEYAYTKAPITMKSVIMSIFLVTNAIGAALGIAISPTAKNPKFMWMYIGLCIATIIAACVFWCVYSHYNNLEKRFQEIEDLAKHEQLHNTLNFPQNDEHVYGDRMGEEEMAAGLDLKPIASIVGEANNFTPLEEAIITTAAETK